MGAYAFKTLKRRGYEAKDILYPSAFAGSPPAGEQAPWRDADGDGLNDVDGWATLEELEAALTGEFAQGAGRLLIIGMDHGHRTRDFMTFRLNETQVLPTAVLDGWLDDLQTSHALDVTLVVDCRYSGQFVEDCKITDHESTTTLAGRKRIVIASTDPNSESVFLPPPDLTSFMYPFLGSAYMGNSMGEAWRAGRRFIDEFPISAQSPQLDDGTTSATSTFAADREFFGASWAYGVQSTMDVNRFFPAFAAFGEYTVSFTARFAYERLSNPVFGHVLVSEGLDPDTTSIRAILALGAAADPDLQAAFGDLGPYAYSVYLDRFQDDSGLSHPEWIDYFIDPFVDADSDGWPSAAAVLDAIGDLPTTAGRRRLHLIGESSAAGAVTLAAGDALTSDALNATPLARQGERTEYDATGLEPLTPYCYQVELVRSDDTTQVWAPPFYGATGPLGLALVETESETVVAEGGAGDRYAVLLQSQPLADVIVSLQVDGQLTVSPGVLTFRPADYNRPREIVVQAVDDDVFEGSHESVIRRLMQSADANYQGQTVDLRVLAKDNDRAVTAAEVRDFLLGRQPLTLSQRIAADANRDGQIDAADLIMIINQEE